MFSIRLKELREKNGYSSQQSFADKFGVAQSTVGGWESGKREPNYSTTIKLAAFFGVTIDELLGVVPLTDLCCGHWDGRKLKQYRAEREESVSHVANAVGISDYVYLEIEHGQREPSLELLCKLASHFCTSTDSLLGYVWDLYDHGKIVTGDFHVTQAEQHLIELYRMAPLKNKEIVHLALNYSDDTNTVPSENVG